MVYQPTKNNQSIKSQTKQINVTGLTQSQQKELFITHINQAGFIGFAKKQAGNQMYYTFSYKK